MQKISVFLIVISFSVFSFSQDNKNSFVEIASWTLIQAVPSPTFYQDNNNENSQLIFGLKWNITPVNYSFNANKLVSHFRFFKVNPLRRYGGSVEIFIQPEWSLSPYIYSNIKRFSISPGIRIFIPFIEYGEYLSGSMGVKNTFRKDSHGTYNSVTGVEFGVYILFGIIGLNYTYNFTNSSRYNFSINLKYY